MKAPLIVSIMAFSSIILSCNGAVPEKDTNALILHRFRKYFFPKHFNGLKSEENKFFCPATTWEYELIDSNCLILMEDNTLQCKRIIKPVLKKSQLKIPCDIDGKSEYYDFVYTICVNDKFGYYDSNNYKKEDAIIKNDELIYRVCYNPKKKKTIFTYHSISRPSLLNNEHLINERNTTYNFKTEAYLLKENNFPQQENAYNTLIHHRKNLNFYRLKPLTLLSPEDMAFALWKKPVYHYINVQPAWENIIKVWNTINNHLRENIIKENFKVFQVNGSMGELELDGKKVYLDQKEKITVPKYFWKLLYIPKGNQLLTVIVHNVPDEKYTLDRLCEESEHHKLKYIEKKWQKLAYSCEANVITDLYHLPQHLSLLKKNINFIPLLMNGKYFCRNEWSTLKITTTQHEVDQKFESCLIQNKNENQFCRTPIDTVSVKSKNNVSFCKSDEEIYYNEVYQICSKNEETKEVSEDLNLILYSYCYNTKSQSTTFTHYRFMIESYNIYWKKTPTNFHLKKYKLQPKMDNFDYISDRYVTKQKYKHELGTIEELHLIPPDDFAFTSWEKSVYLSQNIKLAWIQVIGMWHRINERIRKQAYYEKQDYTQIDGVEDVFLINGKAIEVDEEIVNMPKIFWKVVYSKDMKQSLAVILHNVPALRFIVLKERLCVKSTCRIENWFYIGDFKMFAYCCHSDVITKKYNLPQTEELMEIEESDPYYWEFTKQMKAAKATTT